MSAARSALAITLCLAPGVAHAHLGHEIASAERYIKLDVAGHGARIVVSLTLGPDEGRRVLESADTNHDRTVSEAERDAYLASWGEGLSREVPVLVDGERRELEWGEPYMEPIGPVTRALVTVEMVARIELDGGDELVRIEDRMVRREVYDRTDVAFRARERAELIASSVGEEARPTELTADASYDGGFMRGEPVPILAIVRTEEKPPLLPWPVIAGGLALIVISIAVLVGARLRKR
jgi:hypothetical protein